LTVVARDGTPQIPPLRCASVGMTNLWGALFLLVAARMVNLQVPAQRSG